MSRKNFWRSTKNGVTDHLRMIFIEPPQPISQLRSDLPHQLKTTPSAHAGEPQRELGMVSEIKDTLVQRGSRYGSFAEQGKIEQNIKRVFRDTPNWETLPDDSKSSLEMIAVKVSRILKGDSEYHDSWHDIEGYAKLVADRIENG